MAELGVCATASCERVFLFRATGWEPRRERLARPVASVRGSLRALRDSARAPCSGGSYVRTAPDLGKRPARERITLRALVIAVSEIAERLPDTGYDVDIEFLWGLDLILAALSESLRTG